MSVCTRFLPKLVYRRYLDTTFNNYPTLSTYLAKIYTQPFFLIYKAVNWFAYINMLIRILHHTCHNKISTFIKH